MLRCPVGRLIKIDSAVPRETLPSATGGGAAPIGCTATATATTAVAAASLFRSFRARCASPLPEGATDQRANAAAKTRLAEGWKRTGAASRTH
ncbi:hypothetical protein CUR178_03898 [Leishmania enriettii]|uniref:Uncharacterized protein n=1 Tax=Leishmania enriettii TaxID=5663 RepID=A0A836HH33_LEIEN|nr:hypothetical protein CUR178_03898 [Leishmania enriettii]